MSIVESAQSVELSNSTVNLVGGNQSITTNVYPADDIALAALMPAERNQHYAGCLDGTRTSVLREIDAWLNGMCAS